MPKQHIFSLLVGIALGTLIPIMISLASNTVSKTRKLTKTAGWTNSRIDDGILRRLELLESIQLDFGIYTTRVTVKDLHRAIAETEDTAPSLIEIEVIRMGGFHQEHCLIPSPVWDLTLRDFAGKGKGEW